MGKRLSIYVNDVQEPKYAQVQARAEAVGKTPIDYLLGRDEELEKLNQTIRENNKQNRKGYKVYTLSLGYESKYDKEWISFYGKSLYDGTIKSNDNIVQVYEGTKGKILVLYSLSDSECDYKVVDDVDIAMKEILDIPFKLLDEGYELGEEEFNDLKGEYDELVKEACQAVGVPIIGDNVLNIEF